ncbi:hypothetical protein [Amycolatopsis magusensis]|uniref:hypothetical protein n=1 Tax=Amycolatopsis magusensis TaxID=882444 RepID=UPI0024A9F313|nr:hypothetical protein [Amycolatopsis magusensis]MDI5981920.1 hypothetical protein [Amycolatopsis magusensis]
MPDSGRAQPGGGRVDVRCRKHEDVQAFETRQMRRQSGAGGGDALDESRQYVGWRLQWNQFRVGGNSVSFTHDGREFEEIARKSAWALAAPI